MFFAYWIDIHNSAALVVHIFRPESSVSFIEMLEEVERDCFDFGFISASLDLFEGLFGGDIKEE